HGQPVFLKDIATVIDGIEERRSLARVNGEEAVTLNVARQSGANTVDVAYLVKAEITRIQDILPPDMKINIVADDSTWIEDSIHEILTNIYFGGLLAVIVIFLFLADIRSTVISGLAIPTSIVATFTFMHILGFTLNTMSLMALSLAVGLLIDDAIVVIENIYRHMANGSPPRKAAFEATREIGLAVMATTFSIVVVFLPVAFMKGIVGRFFYEFGMTVAFAVVVSLFVAFSLTPMLASRWLKINDHNTEPPARFLSRILWSVYNRILLIIAPWNRLFNRLNEKYKSLLGWSLNHRFLVMLTAAVVFIGSLFMGGFLGSEFFPQTDQGKIRITVKTPPGTDMPTTSDRIAQIEEIAADFAGVDLIYTTIGAGDDPVNEGTIRIELVDKSERELSVLRIIDSMRTLISELPGIEFSLSAGEGGGGGEKPVEISIRGHDLDILTDLTEKVENIFRETPGAVDIENNLEANKPELKVTIDRDMANDLGVNIFQVASTIRSFVDGQVVTRYKEGDEEYDVRIRLKESMRSKASDIGRLLIASNKEVVGRRTFMVPLSNIAKIEKTSSIGEYRRYDRLREAKVGCNVSTGYFSGTMVQEILQKARQLDIPPGYHIDLTGTGEIQQEAFGYIFTALALAVIFIYLLLASQFESFFDPFSIMFSLPMSLVGAIVALLVFNSSLSIISLIGVILLMGLVTKNAILLIDFIKQNRYKGVERTESILIAGPIRLRPILMTTFAMIFGMLPLALGIGPGAEVRAPMARAVIGGLISSTMLTLIVVPVVYTIIDDIVAYFKGGETITVEKEAIGYAGSDS
ncbi:MAG: AcrB/AcrD/AcrF family protein, partial [Candidatus Zixiibacteriota bacterium]